MRFNNPERKHAYKCSYIFFVFSIMGWYNRGLTLYKKGQAFFIDRSFDLIWRVDL